MQTLAERVQFARSRAKISQEALAHRVGTTKANVSKIELELNKSPAADVLFRIADICQVDPRWLILGTEEAPPPNVIRVDANKLLAQLPDEMREILIQLLERFAEAASQRYWQWAKEGA
jgi:transcriptional regulator with XRE-family HTH domain